MTPGMQVRVVNSYEAATLWVLVRVLSRVLWGRRKVVYEEHLFLLFMVYIVFFYICIVGY